MSLNTKGAFRPSWIRDALGRTLAEGTWGPEVWVQFVGLPTLALVLSPACRCHVPAEAAVTRDDQPPLMGKREGHLFPAGVRRHSSREGGTPALSEVLMSRA